MKRLLVLAAGMAALLSLGPATTGAAPKQCNNNIDDDADGLIDYPADPGCASNGDNSEANSPPPSAPNIVGTTDPTAAEGQNLVFTVTLSGPSVQSTFRLSTTFTTASAADIGPYAYSDDGQASWPSPDGNGDISIDPGQTQFFVRTPLQADALAEATEEFNLFIAPVTNGGTVTGMGIGHITDSSPPAPACSDGLDNDGDSLVDYPADPGCASASDTDEFNAPAVSYPASYFTGPLGAGNLLPSEDGAFLMAWIVAPQSEGLSWSAHQAQMLQREGEIGRTYDALMATDWQSEWGEQHMQWIASGGRIPIVAGLNFGSSATVLSGQANALIDAYEAHYEAMPSKVMIRLNHEFNYCHTVYTSCGNTQAFVDAWRYVVDRFKADGTNNVGFWWSPAEGGDQNRAADAASYPGDAYVDWVGSDSYNHCYVGEAACYATPYEPGWASFGKVFDYPLGFANLETKHNTFGDQKPYMVGETGTVYDAGSPSLKGQWYDEIPEYADANMEWLRGVAFFDVDARAYGEEDNWLVDEPVSNPSALQGFVNMAADPFFNAR
jgi:hypothetical protein